MCIAFFLLANQWLVFDNIIRVWFEFHLGLLSFLLLFACKGRKLSVESVRWRSKYFGMLAFGAMLLLINEKRGSSEWNYIPAVLSVTILLVALLNERDVLARMLSNGVVFYLGKISYSIYMTHYIVLAMVSRGLLKLYPELSARPWLPVLLVIVGTLGASVMSYHLIEKPSRRWLRQIWNRRAAIELQEARVVEESVA